MRNTEATIEAARRLSAADEVLRDYGVTDEATRNRTVESLARVDNRRSVRRVALRCASGRIVDDLVFDLVEVLFAPDGADLSSLDH